jgi:hypothetical protein
MVKIVVVEYVESTDTIKELFLPSVTLIFSNAVGRICIEPL